VCAPSSPQKISGNVASGGSSVSRRGTPPSTPDTYSPRSLNSPDSEPLNATSALSGDQATLSLAGSAGASATSRDPSLRTAYACANRASARDTAIHCPSGDHAGAVPPHAAPSDCTEVPSAVTV